MVPRRAFMLSAAVGGFVLRRRFASAAPAKIYRIIVLMSPTETTLVAALKEGLRELGYVENANVVFDYLAGWAQPERAPALAAELARLNVDLVVAPSSIQVRAAQQATTTVPIVFAGHADPVGTGAVNSLAMPGRNATGLTTMSPELWGKRLELVRELVPRLSRVAVLWNPSAPAKRLDFEEIQAAGRASGIRLHPVEIRGLEDLESGFAAVLKERPGGLLVLGDTVLRR